MHYFALPLSALALVGAAEPPSDSPVPHPAIRQVELSVQSSEHCRDRITQAREDAGKPPLFDRAPASPDKPYKIYAVDKRIDGCSVMVMHGDVSDVRPLPLPSDEPLRVTPLAERGR
jgi:hypothetical protein